MLKKIVISLVTIVVLTTACTTAEPEENGNGQMPINDIMVKSNVSREMSPQITPAELSALVQGNTDFALQFYDQVRDGDSNIIFSPISISLALSMTLAGAENSTQTSMLDGLQFNLTEEEVHPAVNALLLAIEESQSTVTEDREGSSFKLNIANSIWGQSGFDFKEDFLDTLARNYGAGIYSVNFSTQPEEARQVINQWVEEETENRIQDLIPPNAIDPLTRLVLANAIYFNGSWLFPFSETGTTKEPFYLLDGSISEVDMMRLSGERLAYGLGDNFQAVQLPYLSEDFVMTVFVPNLGQLAEFEANLDSNLLKRTIENMGYEEVNLKMPKYEFSNTTNANEVLKILGMEEAFDPELANFSGMTEPEQLFISDVIHKADIKVDENGTEAAAATAVIISVESMMPGEPISLVVDRPFLFFIQHRPTGSILFMGRVTEP